MNHHNQAFKLMEQIRILKHSIEEIQDRCVFNYVYTLAYIFAPTRTQSVFAPTVEKLWPIKSLSYVQLV